MWRLTTAALLATGACAVKVDLKSKFAGLNADAEEKNLAKPLTFHQKLLVCNAYPSDEGMVISKNAVHLASNEALPYNSCKYVDGKVFNKDRVNFSFQKAGIEGTFEVDELPSSDSVLLLIVSCTSVVFLEFGRKIRVCTEIFSILSNVSMCMSMILMRLGTR